MKYHDVSPAPKLTVSRKALTQACNTLTVTPRIKSRSKTRDKEKSSIERYCLQSASLSAELLKNRDEVVATYGDRWKRIRSPQVTVLRTFMRAEGRGILETAHRLARQYCDDDMPNTARFILAVAVEEIEAEGRAA